eukprot:CAMPEP_0117588146 /NCGR_PEP_ID=MMETSP0784-20121206/69699_1 /TAXON_ID=39447 /ORGANISM="" /LENGTH=56 /DNA_ID=CAMNT_0005389493 /DNA_START=60 /DNA_END=227 /DNA_ORIENTATION=-
MGDRLWPSPDCNSREDECMKAINEQLHSQTRALEDLKQTVESQQSEMKAFEKGRDD